MSNADLFMWFMIVFLAELVAFKVWDKSASRRLRKHVARLYDERRESTIDVDLLREEACELRERLEATLLDWRRDLRKLARARTSRARWQAMAAEHERRYRNEFKRADQAETRLMRWQYRKYNTPAPVTLPALRPEQAQALREGFESLGLCAHGHSHSPVYAAQACSDKKL